MNEENTQDKIARLLRESNCPHDFQAIVYDEGVVISCVLCNKDLRAYKRVTS